MFRERLALSMAVLSLGCLISWPSPVDAQKDDPAAQRLDKLEQRVSELEGELQKVRLEQANDRLLDRLYGQWKEERSMDGGRRKRNEDEVRWELQSEASSTRTIFAEESSQWLYGRMTVDTSKNPVWITFHGTDGNGKEIIRPGIIKLEYSFLGGCLEHNVTIALPRYMASGSARPTTFESTETNGVMVFELLRSRCR